MKKVLIVVNTGTPDSTDIKDVRKYLSEFLNDPYVISLPWLLRKILVNLVIVPFRAPRSAKLYRKVWTKSGSPLRTNLDDLVSKLQKKAGDDIVVKGAMRYGLPSLKAALEAVINEPANEITIFPLYPQYASSTTGSVRNLVYETYGHRQKLPALRFIEDYHSHPAFIETFARTISNYVPTGFDHVVFSYHGLPLSHIRKVHPGHEIEKCECTKTMPPHGSHCYRAACYETTRLLARKLNLADGNYSTSFQSRLSGNWLSPFTDEVVKELAHAGKKRILVAAPSFTADCLETLIEIGEEYSRLFKKEGGEKLTLAESLNAGDEWAEAILKII